MDREGGRILLGMGLAGLGLFAIALAVLHVLNWDALAHSGRHVSNLVHLRGGWFWDVGLAGLGIGTILVVAGLRRTLDVRGPPTWGLRALEGAGLLILLMIAFPTDRNVHAGYASTITGYIHDSCAVFSTFLISWAMLLLVASARIDPAWRGVPGRSWLWPLSTIALSLAWMGGDVTQYWPIASVVQRAVVAVMAAWLFTTGWRALSAQAPATGTPQPVPPPQPMR